MNIETVFYSVLLAVLIMAFMMFIKVLLNKDLDKIYREMVFEYLDEFGLKRAIADRISKSDQSMINKFLDITDRLDKQNKGNGSRIYKEKE